MQHPARSAAFAAAFAALAAASIPGQAGAQAADASKLPPTQAFDPPPVDHVFGDWGGLLPTLQADGINFQLNALTEFAGNVSGGTRQGATFANQVGLNSDINWERLAGLTGLSTHVIMVSRSGSSDSLLFGDKLEPVQEIYGSGGNVIVHLVSAYAQETLLDHTLDFAVGRMNVENDFASSSLYCNFMTNGLCGDPKALPGGDIGHSAYPDAVWAGRVKIRPLPEFYITTGIYQVTQGLYTNALYRSGFKFNGSQDSGVYLPVELGWEPALGPDQMPGHYKIGFGYDTSSGYKDFGNALAADGVPGYATRYRTGNTQVWALADQMLIRNGNGPADGLIGLAGFIHNDPNNSVYAEQYILGLTDHDFWHARPKDGISLLMLYNTVSGRLGNIQAVEAALGLPLSNNATGIQTHEVVFEANYAVNVIDGLTFMPDFQYIVRPSAEKDIADAAVFGFRLNVQF